MKNNTYILITGSKENAGDFLIKRRSIELLSTLRPDRDIYLHNSWEAFNKSSIELINNSRAILLAGGPSLQTNMYPEIYKLSKNINEIKVPIITLGIGGKNHNYLNDSCKNYLLNKSSLRLLHKINNSGFQSSVRDNLTLKILEEKGFHNFINTGCPALFTNNKNNDFHQKPKSICFSLGVSYKYSKKMFFQMKNIMIFLKSTYDLEVVLHHSPKKGDLRLMELFSWFKDNNIKYFDISKSDKLLIETYTNCDIHIGYRVHAHIFRLSINKTSILLAEDSRGVGLNNTIPSHILNAYYPRRINFLNKFLIKFYKNFDHFDLNKNLIDEIHEIISNDSKLNNLSQVKKRISKKYEVTKGFCNQLP
jgi:hypothetical protein